MSLNNKFFFLSPVEVVKVTPKNFEEVAEWCGGKVAKVESRRVKGRIDQYVWVPTPKGSVISWAFPGMYITKRLAINEKNEIKETFSVFRKDYFGRNYFEDLADAVDKTWERQDRELKKAHREARTITIVVPEGEDVAETTLKLENLMINIDTMQPVEEITVDEALIQATDDLPDSMIEQREALHEDAVEAAAEDK